MYKSAGSAAATATHELKQRVFTCLDRLSDRDTLAQAAAELESIARTLSPGSLSPFVACCLSVDSAHKSPVRAQSIRLLSILAATHRTSLSPHLSKILPSLLRRLRDPDSTVRSACVDAVSSLSLNLTSSPFTAFLDPLLSAVLTEQDSNSQTGAALCLSAAIEAVPEVDAAEVRKVVPKLVRLLKSENFKAKPALLGLIGSVVEVNDGAVVGSRDLLGSVVGCVVWFLRSEDWAARKAAAEVLEKVAVTAERGLAAEVKKLCVCSLENRRFDKVKVTRETMNRALEAWKEVPSQSEDESHVSGSNSSASKDTTTSEGQVCSPPHISKSCNSVCSETPQSRKTVTTTTSRSRSSVSESDESTTTFSPPTSSSPSHVHVGLEMARPKKTMSKSKTKSRSSFSAAGSNSIASTVLMQKTTTDPKKSNSRKLTMMPVSSRDLCDKGYNWSTEEIALPRTTTTPSSKGYDLLESRNLQVPVASGELGSSLSGCETSGSFFNKTEERMQKFGRFRSASPRVVPFREEDQSEAVGVVVVVDNGVADDEQVYDKCAEFEGMSLIREQLVHIERQQSNLLDLLQSFMGTSQNGICSLETRVSGLEHALDEISYNLALQTGRMPDNEYADAGNICCSLPGAEFLSHKFWRKTEGHYPGTPNHILNGDNNNNNNNNNNAVANKVGMGMGMGGDHKLQWQSSEGSACQISSGVSRNSRRTNTELDLVRTPKNLQIINGQGIIQASSSSSSFDGAS